MPLLRQKVICDCPIRENLDDMQDLIDDTDSQIQDIFGSDKELDEGESEEYKKSELYLRLKEILEKFMFGLEKYVADDFDLHDHWNELECENFMITETPRVLDAALHDIAILETSILDNEKIVSKIKSERFIYYNNIRKLLLQFHKKLIAYDFERLNYYTAKINELLLLIHRYLLSFIFKVVVLNLDDDDGYNYHEHEEEHHEEEHSTNGKCNCKICHYYTDCPYKH